MILTIVFWDISGFSHLCGLLKEYPQKVEEFLKDYSETATKIIFDHLGVLDKFIGDGVMAFFGFQSQGQNGKQSSICAVEGALEFKCDTSNTNFSHYSLEGNNMLFINCLTSF